MLLICIIIVAAAVLVLVAWLIACYNKLVRISTAVDESKSQIDVMLKRRNDLIPNLVSTIKGYIKHESDVLKTITNERSSKSLHLAVEAYPELKANQNFAAMHDELIATENRIAQARQLYNANASDLNEMLKTIPYVLFASKFTTASYLEIDDVEKENVKVDFGA